MEYAILAMLSNQYIIFLPRLLPYIHYLPNYLIAISLP